MFLKCFKLPTLHINTTIKCRLSILSPLLKIHSFRGFGTKPEQPIIINPNDVAPKHIMNGTGRPIISASFIDKLPAKLIPYAKLMRLDKPIGTYLLFIPCTWSILLTPLEPIQTITNLLVFFVGSLLLRSAGCVINDLWDINYDRQVERTLDRPLASGELTPINALTNLLVLLTMGAGILFSMNLYTILLGFSALGLVVIYPLMKRYTNYPQVVLGLCFNYGILMGEASILSANTLGMAVIYLGAVQWTVFYDTIYALQDIKDDLKVGVKSTAITFGENVDAIILNLAIGSTSFLTLGGFIMGVSGFYYIGCVGVLGHYLWQMKSLKKDRSTKNLWALFASNRYLGIIFSFGCLLEYLYRLF